MDAIERLIAAVQASGLKRLRVATDAGMPATKLSKILNRKQIPTVLEFIAIARAIGADPALLLTDGDIVVEVDQVRTAHAAVLRAQEILSSWLPPAAMAPVVSLVKPARDRSASPVRAAADPNAELIAELETERVLIPRTAWNRGARIIAKVVGDSMDGGNDPLRNGELAYLKPTRSPRTANGRVVLLRRDDALFLKRFAISGHTIRLTSTNERYETIELDARAENVQLFGYLVDHSPVGG
ncbi:MAG TPA: S24 family peptidase [Thermoanaerobaculia bacterium]|nr:S24 family peptidase [Thermoanaerobaculia bacterium]